jgi:hypothetical protein
VIMILKKKKKSLKIYLSKFLLIKKLNKFILTFI